MNPNFKAIYLAKKTHKRFEKISAVLEQSGWPGRPMRSKR